MVLLLLGNGNLHQKEEDKIFLHVKLGELDVL